MKTVSVNFANPVGKMKPMHAVNNGPVYKFAEDQRITNLPAFKAAGIPYARNHDASFCSTYGGNHTVDVNFIFPDFDADPYDPASYDFIWTDEYIRATEAAGTKTFYRLGSRIEHGPKKYNTLPPKDFHKWAVICEHIICHYTEGWADGFRYDMEYWEIWNEPDLTTLCTWGGTEKQFFELYDVAARHLKEKFPHLKIGGPAVASHMEWAERFLAQLTAPLDFFSWHCYSPNVEKIEQRTLTARRLLDKYGFSETESILNEWNYVKGWTGDDWVYSLRMEKGLKGAAFIGAVMCTCQKLPLDMLMYYDARPCGMNGMFNTDFVCDCLKGYYPFYMFNVLYRLGTEVESQKNDDVYICAARKEDEAAVMLTRFCVEDHEVPEEVAVDLQGFGPCTVQVYILDEQNDLTLMGTEHLERDSAELSLTVAPQSSYLLKLKK